MKNCYIFQQTPQVIKKIIYIVSATGHDRVNRSFKTSSILFHWNPPEIDKIIDRIIPEMISKFGLRHRKLFLRNKFIL